MLTPTIYRSLKAMLLDVNEVDVFVYGTVEELGHFNTSRLRELYHPWLQSYAILADSELNEERNLAIQHQAKGPHPMERQGTILSLYTKMFKCHHHLIAPYELARGQKYESVIQTRPDLEYLEPLDLALYATPNVVYFGDQVCECEMEG